MNSRNIAHMLVELSATPEGLPDASRVKAVCGYVSQTFAPLAALKILRAYRKKIAALESENSARIASAGELDGNSKKALEAFVKSKKRNAQIQFVNDDSLIAGVKVSVGDTVWENSVRMKLEELKQSLGA